jgi:low affinity Fe/Cu permease
VQQKPRPHDPIAEWFRHFAARSSDLVGSATAFLLAVVLVVVWGFTGPLVGYSADWELVINTVTTIITFLMVFLIQNAQNRDSRAVELKLDELLRAVKGARTGLVRLEELTDAQIAQLQEEFRELHEPVPPKLPSSGAS